MGLTIFHTARFADHMNPPGHPERHERAEVMARVAARKIRASDSTSKVGAFSSGFEAVRGCTRGAGQIE